MADKFSFEEGTESTSKEVVLDSVDSLRECVNSLSVFAELEKRVNDVVVRVQDFAGGAEYLAKGNNDLWFLNDISYKKEKRGTFTLYYIKLDGRKVTRP